MRVLDAAIQREQQRRLADLDLVSRLPEMRARVRDVFDAQNRQTAALHRDAVAVTSVLIRADVQDYTSGSWEFTLDQSGIVTLNSADVPPLVAAKVIQIAFQEMP